MNLRRNSLFAASALALALISPLQAVAQTPASKEDELDFNYVHVQGGWAFPSRAPLSVDLGRGVQLPGRIHFSGGATYGVALGRQFYRDRDDDGTVRAPRGSREDEQDETKPVRVELEWWTAQLKRRQIQFGNVDVRPNDTVRPQVVFLNVALPIAESDERVEVAQDEKPRERGNEPLWRWWLGAGLGHARMSYAGATALSGCDCLRAVDGSGLAFQLKLIGERRISQDTYFFGQVGHVWLPGVTSKGASLGQTEHGRWGAFNAVLGFRFAWR